MELATGTLLGGYRIERRVGEGGMGVVYLARQVSLDRPVALKLISPGRAADEGFRARFLAESQIAASIDHPNVVPVHEAAEQDGVLYVAMRYVDGPDLGALLRATGPMAPARAARIAAQVGAALDAAHARGLVHRDVKPANVLVAGPGEEEHCYLTDFGLTKRSASQTALTRTGEIMGTVHYIAPEQLRGDVVDGRADVYALGCVLFELLTGRPPFVRDSDVATLWAHLSEDPPSLGEGAPAALDAVVRRAMAKDPGDRFATAGELGRAALEAAGGSAAPLAVPPASGPVGAAAPVGRRAHRRRAVLLGAAAAVAAAAGVGAVVAGGGDDPPPAADAAQLRITRRIPVGGVPLTASLAGGRLWVSSEDEGRLTSVDPATGAVEPSRPYGEALAVTAAGEGRLWVADFGEDAEDGEGEVVEVDPASGRALRRIATIEPYRLEAGDGSLWLTDASDTVQRVDVARGRAQPGAVLDRPFDVALLAGRAWVVANGRGELVPYDARTGRRAGRPIAVGARPLGVAAGAGALWVVTEPGQLVRVVPGEARTASVAIGPPDPQRLVAADDERVWVVDGRGEVVAADARRPASQRRVRVGPDLTDVVPDGRGAWVLRVTSDAASTVVRVELR